VSPDGNWLFWKPDVNTARADRLDGTRGVRWDRAVDAVTDWLADSRRLLSMHDDVETLGGKGVLVYNDADVRDIDNRNRIASLVVPRSATLGEWSQPGHADSADFIADTGVILGYRVVDHRQIEIQRVAVGKGGSVSRFTTAAPNGWKLGAFFGTGFCANSPDCVAFSRGGNQIAFTCRRQFKTPVLPDRSALRAHPEELLKYPTQVEDGVWTARLDSNGVHDLHCLGTLQSETLLTPETPLTREYTGNLTNLRWSPDAHFVSFITPDKWINVVPAGP